MNLETISFTKSHTYNTLQTGITVPVTLQTGFESVDFEAKLIREQVFVFLNANTASVWAWILKAEHRKDLGR